MDRVYYNEDDPSCIYDNGIKGNQTVYSDRLFQWDSKKHDTLCRKYFGNDGQG
jgi:hypothetical protein